MTTMSSLEDLRTTIFNYYTNVADVSAWSSKVHIGPIVHGIEGGNKLQQRRNAILPKLNRVQYREAKSRNPSPAPQTCQWALTHDQYIQWREYDSSSLLLVSANPSCGKSVLARHLVDTALRDRKRKRYPSTICYFFFKEDFPGQKRLSNALCCLLHQIFVAKTDLLDENLCQRFESYGDLIYESTLELWDILIMISNHPDAGEIICVLDAFDQCLDDDQPKLSQALQALSQDRTEAKLKFVITSRPYANILFNFRGIHHFYLRRGGEATVKDIARRSTSDMPGTGVFEIRIPNHANSSPVDSTRNKYKTANSSFLDDLPISKEEWKQKKEECELFTARHHIHVLRWLTHFDPPNKKPADIVQRYADLPARVPGRLHNYSRILLYCACLVALNSNMTVGEVDDILKRRVPTVQSTYSTKLRRSGRYAAAIIDNLETNMGSVCSQLFLLYGPTMDTYRRWTELKNCDEYVITEVQTRCKPILQPSSDTTFDLSFSPAFLICYACPWSLNKVNTALGTKLSQADYDRNLRSLREMESLYPGLSPRLNGIIPTAAGRYTTDKADTKQATSTKRMSDMGNIEFVLPQAVGEGVGFGFP